MISNWSLLGLLRDKLESDRLYKQAKAKYYQTQGLASLQQSDAMKTTALAAQDKAPAEIEKLRAEAFSTKRLASTPLEIFGDDKKKMEEWASFIKKWGEK